MYRSLATLAKILCANFKLEQRNFAKWNTNHRKPPTFVITGRMAHSNCRNALYRGCEVRRFHVPDEKVAWDVKFENYNPPDYNAPCLKSAPWADKSLSDATFQPRFNQLDGMVDRRSHQQTYRVVNGRPLNPMGRTGLSGRGCLGKWGPNHAVDCIVTRWKRGGAGTTLIHKHSGKSILEFVAIARHDTGEYAIPGGMVDSGESALDAVKREFLEETLNYFSLASPEQLCLKQLIDESFLQAEKVFSGYVDDPRNTDNAWMETTAFNVHDNAELNSLHYVAGSDAVDVQWQQVDNSEHFYASHAQILAVVAKMHEAHW